MMSQMMRLIEKQDELIALQGDIIDDLWSLLSQHLSAAEMSGLPTVSKIKRAEKLRNNE